MADFQNPLDQEFIRELYKVKRDAWGDDLTRPRQFNIGRLNADGSVSTVVINGEYNRVWVHQPGKDTGDAVQAISTLLDSDDMTPYRPVMVKIIRGELVIVGKAIESANYDAQLPVAPQRAINRLQYNVALITPSRPDTSFYAEYRGGIFQLNNVAYRVTDAQSSDFSGTVPGANALSIKIELDPVTGTWHETTGSSFTFSSMNAAYKNGDLDTARTFGRYLIGWIRLYDGQTSIELDDILPAEYMLDIIDDHAALNNLGADDHTQYVHITPASSVRNIIEPTGGDFIPLTVRGYSVSQAAKIFVAEEGSADTEVFSLSGTGRAIFQNFTDSTTGFQVFDKDGGTPILNVDTTNEFVGIGTNSPGEELDVRGSALIWTQADTPALEVRGNTGSGVNVNVLVTTDGDGQELLILQREGNTTFLSKPGSTSAFAIWNYAGSNPVFNADTTNENVAIGASSLSAHYDLLLGGDGVLAQKETTTPTADPNYGKQYWKTDDEYYGQNPDGVEHVFIAGIITNAAESDILVRDEVNGTWINDPQLVIKNEPTGFENRTDTSLAFDNTTRIFTLTKINDWTHYEAGKRYIHTASETVQIGNSEGQHWIYYVNGSLVSTASPTSAELLVIIGQRALVTGFYWDADNQEEIWFGEERHGVTMDGVTHSYLHVQEGTRYRTGLAFDSFSIDGSGNDNASSQFNVGNGQIADEDNVIQITNNLPQTLGPAEIPVFYRDGANGHFRRFVVTDTWLPTHVYSLGDRIRGDDSYFEVTVAGTSGGVEPTWAGNTEPGDTIPADGTVTWTCIGSPRAAVRTHTTGANYRLAWNELTGGSWQQTEVGQLQYVLTHIFATNDINYPIIAIQGQATYATQVAAREGATTELNSIITAGLPMAEFRAIGTVIYQTGNSYTNESKSRIRSTDTGENYVDFREQVLVPGAGTSDHGSLAGLGDDDHTQYALLAGRAGGQVAYGGTNASDILSLNSTSDATKGTILFDTNSWIDGTKNALFLNTETPTSGNINALCIGRTAFSSAVHAIDLRSWSPSFKQTAYRDSGTGFAVATNDIYMENDTTEAHLSQFGIFGNVNLGGTPYLTYVYLSSLTSPAYNNNNMRLHASGNVSVGINNNSDTAALHVSTPSDQLQQVVRAHSTQTGNISEWHDDTDEKGVAISPDGKEARWYDPGASHYVGLKSPALTGSQTYIWPDADGTANQRLATDGSGNWFWDSSGAAGSAPKTLLVGMELYRQSNAILGIRTGTVSHYGTLLEDSTDIQLDLGTGANWIGGSTLEPTSGWVQWYKKSDNTNWLSDSHPNLPTAAAPVADMRVNVASGLDLTSVPYDAGTTGDAVEAGMYALFYSDSGHTTGLNKGATGSSVNSLAVALITATTGGAATGTLTLEANHEIYINDNDYILIVEAGDLLYRDVSGTYYRHIGAWWNNGSSNLVAIDNNVGTNKAYSFINVTGAVADTIATSSTSFVNVATQYNVDIISTGNPIKIQFTGNSLNSGATSITYMDVIIDGQQYTSNNGLKGERNLSANFGVSLNFNVLITGLLPGNHTIELVWKVSGGSSSLYPIPAFTPLFDTLPTFAAWEVLQ